MQYLGLGLFIAVFAMLMPSSRAMLGNALTGAIEFIVNYAPFSYIVLAVILIVPVVAAIMVMNVEPPPEPENPLARYKNADDVMDD